MNFSSGISVDSDPDLVAMAKKWKRQETKTSKTMRIEYLLMHRKICRIGNFLLLGRLVGSSIGETSFHSDLSLDLTILVHRNKSRGA